MMIITNLKHIGDWVKGRIKIEKYLDKEEEEQKKTISIKEREEMQIEKNNKKRKRSKDIADIQVEEEE